MENFMISTDGGIAADLLPSTPAPSSARRFNSSVAQTFLAEWRIHFATGLGWLLDLRKPRAVTSWTCDFCSNWRLHKIRFLKVASDQICRCALHLPHVIMGE
jgi:hypothetical protein